MVDAQSKAIEDDVDKSKVSVTDQKKELVIGNDLEEWKDAKSVGGNNNAKKMKQVETLTKSIDDSDKSKGNVTDEKHELLKRGKFEESKETKFIGNDNEAKKIVADA